MSATVAYAQTPSLYEIEERLDMLFSSEDFIDPAAPDAEHLRAMLAHEIAQTLSAELTKVDGIATYLAYLENQQEFAGKEIDRLTRRQLKFKKRQERIEAKVISLLQMQRRQRIDGRTSFLALQCCPASLDVFDEAAVPSEWKNTRTPEPVTTVDKNRVKAAIKATHVEVPGCRMITDKQKLIRG